MISRNTLRSLWDHCWSKELPQWWVTSKNFTNSLIKLRLLASSYMTTSPQWRRISPLSLRMKRNKTPLSFFGFTISCQTTTSTLETSLKLFIMSIWRLSTLQLSLNFTLSKVRSSRKQETDRSQLIFMRKLDSLIWLIELSMPSQPCSSSKLSKSRRVPQPWTSSSKTVDTMSISMTIKPCGSSRWLAEPTTASVSTD